LVLVPEPARDDASQGASRRAEDPRRVACAAKREPEREPEQKHERGDPAEDRRHAHAGARVLLDADVAGLHRNEQETRARAVARGGFRRERRELRRLPPEEPAVARQTHARTVLALPLEGELAWRGGRPLEQPLHDPVVELPLVAALLRAGVRDEVHPGPGDA